MNFFNYRIGNTASATSIVRHREARKFACKLDIHSVDYEKFTLICKDKKELDRMESSIKSGYTIKFDYESSCSNGNIIISDIVILSKKNNIKNEYKKINIVDASYSQAKKDNEHLFLNVNSKNINFSHNN